MTLKKHIFFDTLFSILSFIRIFAAYNNLRPLQSIPVFRNGVTQIGYRYSMTLCDKNNETETKCLRIVYADMKKSTCEELVSA